jgi:4'-phosphopantetheinyl transferase
MNIKPWQESLESTALPSEGIQVWSANFDKEDSSHYFHLLSEDEKRKASRLKCSKTANQQIISRGILRLILANRVGKNPKELIFDHGPSGKPFLSTPSNSGICFNLSHSGNQLLIAFGNGKHIGIDVEKIEEEIDFTGISSLVFSAEEQHSLSRSQDHIRDFYALWTAKEAILKASGLGFTYPSNHFSVDISKGIVDLSMLSNELTGGYSCSIFPFSPEKGYSATVASLQ